MVGVQVQVCAFGDKEARAVSAGGGRTTGYCVSFYSGGISPFDDQDVDGRECCPCHSEFKGKHIEFFKNYDRRKYRCASCAYYREYEAGG